MHKFYDSNGVIKEQSSDDRGGKPMRWSSFICSCVAVVSIIACVGQGIVKGEAPDKQAARNIRTYKVPTAQLMDSDGDGVASYMDECPNTPTGIKVDRNGCCLPDQAQEASEKRLEGWIFKDIRFGYNKADFDSKYITELTDISSALKASPEMHREIQGHSDSYGNRAYNYKLSERRAKSVSVFLQAAGIAEDRIKCISYGSDRPIASNATSDGRSINRRVATLPIN
jgi:outer membrane protein OmpA-like peptidoglycan-associated protein